MSLIANFELAMLAEKFSIFAGRTVLVAGGDICIDSSPYVQEQALVLRAVASRKIEFYSGRHYAREALQQIGYPSQEILRGKKGDPLWPTGVVGSITHDLQDVIVVVAQAAGIKGVGVDLILSPAAVEPYLQPLIASELELRSLVFASASISPLALAFGLKEAVVKAISPSIDYYLDLQDISLAFEGGRLVARVHQLQATLHCDFMKFKTGFVAFSVYF